MIPKLLLESPKHPSTSQFHPQLIAAYRFCLDCLNVASSELCGKVYGVQLQRARFVHCLLKWENYDEGFDEGVRVLRELGKAELVGFRFRVSEGEIVPKIVECGGEGGDREGSEEEFVRLIEDLVVLISQCVSIGKSKDVGKYSGLLVLLEDVRPWFSQSKDSVSGKLQWKLLALMKNITNYLIREVKYFGADLVSGFCAATFNEYTRLLNSHIAKDRTGEELNEFIQFLYMCVYQCRFACTNVQFCVAMHLYKSSGNFCQDLLYVSSIQRLYAMGLYLSEFGAARGSDDASCTSGLLLEDWDELENLSSLLEYCKSYFCTNSEAYMSFCLNVLKFLCGLLAQFVHDERQRIVIKGIDPPFENGLKIIQETFMEYYHAFTLSHEWKVAPEELDTIVLSISVASLTLSLNLFSDKRSKRFVNHLLSDNRLSLQPKMLNYIVLKLHNLFVDCYKHERLKEASKAGKICCRALWSRCVLLCEIYAGNVKGSEGEISEKMIMDSVSEACKDNTLLVEIIHQVDSQKLDKVVIRGLENWCLARTLFGHLPSPKALIQRWGKIQCRLYAHTNANAPILGYLILCPQWSQTHTVLPETIGLILQEELLVYQEMSNFYPEFCRRMQMLVIDTLLSSVLPLNDGMQRCIFLAKKGMLLRNLEVGELENCIHCLSEAIKTIDVSSEGNTVNSASMSHHLAVVYCLRALCIQESNPRSKELFTDISEAVSIWMLSDFADLLEGDGELGCEYVLSLLYHIADLLSIKGDTALHSGVFDVILKVLKQMNVSVDRCLALLWESRRANHALCATPVNEGFLVAMSKYYSKEVESFDFWMTCAKGSQLLSVGLRQFFSFLSSHFHLEFYENQSLLQSEISVDEVLLVASNLISNATVSGSSRFGAAYLYYDASERLFSRGKMIQALSYV